MTGLQFCATERQHTQQFLVDEKNENIHKVIDPACGSGNFLTETYLSLRRLENKVISILNKGEAVLGFDEFIKVHINQFYGIEINDFAVTVAKTALWIAETEAILSQNRLSAPHHERFYRRGKCPSHGLEYA